MRIVSFSGGAIVQSSSEVACSTEQPVERVRACYLYFMRRTFIVRSCSCASAMSILCSCAQVHGGAAAGAQLLSELLLLRHHPDDHLVARPELQRRQRHVPRRLRLLRELLLALTRRLCRAYRRLLRRPARCASALASASAAATASRRLTLNSYLYE